MREGSAGRRGHLSSVLPLFLSPLYVFRGAQSSDLRGGQQQSLTDECFLNISCAHQKRVCLCVFVFDTLNPHLIVHVMHSIILLYCCFDVQQCSAKTKLF